MKFPAFEPINLKNDAQSCEIIDLYLTQVEPDNSQPRKNFCESLLEELALSIKKHGVIQPILVKELQKGKKYQIIAGERRWRAAKIAGLEKIPSIIKEYDKASSLAIALIENIQRQNLNPLEEASAIQCLLEECKMTHTQVAENLGKSRTTITNLLRLLMLSIEVKEMINAGKLEMGHARALLCLAHVEQVKVANFIIDNSLSVRETEKYVQNKNKQHQKSPRYISPNFEDKAGLLEDLISKKFSSRVDVTFSSRGKVKIALYFDSLEEANQLIDIIT